MGPLAAVALLAVAAFRVTYQNPVDPLRGGENVLARASVLRESVSVARRPVIEIYSDFGCSVCRRLDSLIAATPRIEAEFIVIHRHLPIIGGQHSRDLALLSICLFSGRSSAAQRLPFYANASRTQRAAGDSILGAIRDGPRRRAIEECQSSTFARERLAADEAAGRALSLGSTPGILIDSMLFRGLPPDFRKRLFHLTR